MGAPVISVEGLSKRYFLSHQKRQDTLRDSLMQAFRQAGRRLAGAGEAAAGREEFWALRDVSFQVGQGEVVGIIGRNGAGKSTLLKLLSRISDPTSGRIRLRGRVASLLEVGTGFHPELTGRENIYLNGAILGMSRAEIRSKFAEIAAFAEVERFLDTQVKHYSSGMYVRLAFAVAAHLEPEILIVDEVLAVGDAEFQKRCIGKMRDITQSGRTVLLVSHNLGVIQSLCSHCLLLNQGRVVSHGAPAAALAAYLDAGTAQQSFRRPPDPAGRPTLTAGAIKAIEESDLLLELTVTSATARKVALEVRLSNLLGQPLGFGSLGAFRADQLLELPAGETHLTLRCSAGRLANGSYQLGLALSVPFVEFLDRVDDALAFDLQRMPEAGAHHVLVENWGYGATELVVRRLS